MVNYIGILYFSNKEYITYKHNIIGKKFTPFFKQVKSFVVKTKKILEKKDMYVKVHDNVVSKYIGYVGDLNIEKVVIEELAMCNWTLRVNKLFHNLYLYDNVIDRIDLTDREIYSIDPKGSIDIDDAIHYKKLDNMEEIGIHIADPTSYIDYNSLIDIELSKRCESVYTTDKTYHMIDETFMINNLSLIEGNIRRACTLLIYIQNNSVTSYKFIRSKIKVTKNLTYEDNIPSYLSTYSKLLAQFYKINYYEPEFDSHKMVELYMIVTNHLAALEIYKKNGLIRVQESPFGNGQSLALLHGQSDTNLKKLYNQYLSYKAQYKYATDNEYQAHFTLGLSVYTHFTSPIRRYADIIVHRQLYSDMNVKPSCAILNTMKTYYKSIKNYETLLDIMNIIPNSYIDEIGIIIYIKEEYCGVYIEKFNKTFIIKVIHKILKQSVNIKYYENKIIINNIPFNGNECVREINLFDKLQFRICKNIYNINKVKLYILL